MTACSAVDLSKTGTQLSKDAKEKGIFRDTSRVSGRGQVCGTAPRRQHAAIGSVKQAAGGQPFHQHACRLAEQLRLALIVVRCALDDVKRLVGAARGLVDGD